MKTLFVDVEGVPTHYFHAGSGEPVVLLHGIGLSADCFHRNIEALAAYREVLAIDMIGHGLTGYAGLGGRMPLAALSQHVLRFMHTLGIHAADFIGSSLGGGVALYSYLVRPSAVRRCVVAGSSTPFVSGRMLGQVLSKARANALKSFELGTEAVLEERLRNLIYDPAAMSHELVSAQVEIYSLPDRARAYNDIVDGVVRFGDDPAATPAAQLENVMLPVLAIAGRDDPRSPLDVIREGIGKIPKGEMKIYDRCGHFPFLEHPKRFDEDVRMFLESSASPQ